MILAKWENVFHYFKINKLVRYVRKIFDNIILEERLQSFPLTKSLKSIVRNGGAFLLQKRGWIMAYWVSELGSSRTPENVKSFYCDFRSDIEKLPNNTDKGDLNAGDEASAKPCRYGSDCMRLEDSSVWILGKETNAWKEV